MDNDCASEYQQTITDLNETYKTGIRAFAKWFAANWKINRTEWESAFDSPWPGDKYGEGYNAGVESVEAAADSFLGDYHL